MQFKLCSPPFACTLAQFNSVELPALPKDDLFENSTMTFGEHLEELRGALAKAIICLVIGMCISLGFFADSLIRYVQAPLEDAIRQFRAERDIARLNLSEDDPKVQELQAFLASNGLTWELSYEIPADLMADYEFDPANPLRSDQIAGLLKQTPQPDQLVPRYFFRNQEAGLISLKVEEPFMIWMKAGLIMGAVLGSPGIFYFIWKFVAAGLHTHERRYVYVFAPLSAVLFSGGVALAFFLVLKFVLSFLLNFNHTLDVQVEPQLSTYISFVLMLPLGFGIAFQLPLVMFFLQRIGLIETQSYVNSWRIAILIIAIMSVFLTPADITSMFAMMIPLVILYFLGIAMCKYFPRGRGLGSQAYDPR